MEVMIERGQLKMDAMDLGKKSAVEKELEVKEIYVFLCVQHLSTSSKGAGDGETLRRPCVVICYCSFWRVAVK